MTKQIRLVAPGLALLVLSGCASTSPQRSFGQVDAMLSERTGGTIRVSQERSAAALKERTAALMKDGLTPESGYINAVKNYWVERAGLERALGAAIPHEAAASDQKKPDSKGEQP